MVIEKSGALEDMVLVLLYIFSWKEKVTPNFFVVRSWKGYSFELLDALDKKGYISSSRKAKSVIITDDGIDRAAKLKERMLTVLASLQKNME